MVYVYTPSMYILHEDKQVLYVIHPVTLISLQFNCLIRLLKKKRQQKSLEYNEIHFMIKYVLFIFY